MKIQDGRRRTDGRSRTELRPIYIRAGVVPFAEGSAEVSLGATRVIAATSLSERPRVSSDEVQVRLHLLPRAMRIKLEDESLKRVVADELRSLERLISKSLEKAAENVQRECVEIGIDCNIVCSDAGISSAAIAACWTSLYQALRYAAATKLLAEDTSLARLAAVSVGIVDGLNLVDLTAEESANAEFSGNLIFDEQLRLIEVRAASERTAIDPQSLLGLLDTGVAGASRILQAEEKAVLEIS